MVQLLMAIVYGFLGALWRRGFGCDFWGLPLLKIRAIGHVLAACALFVLFYFYKDMSLFLTLIAIGVIQGLFWAPGHGAAFDMSRGGLPDETLIKRYEDVFFAKFVNFLVPKSMWYGFGYDFLWMTMRYTWPLVFLTPIFSASVLLLGPSVVLIYAACWSWYEKGMSKTKESKPKNDSLPFNLQPTQLAEIIVGALAGIFWVVL